MNMLNAVSFNDGAYRHASMLRTHIESMQMDSFTTNMMRLGQYFAVEREINRQRVLTVDSWYRNPYIPFHRKVREEIPYCIRLEGIPANPKYTIVRGVLQWNEEPHPTFRYFHDYYEWTHQAARRHTPLV